MFSQPAERSKRGNFKQLMTFFGAIDVLNRYVFYHLERYLIYSILTTFHPSLFFPISFERCKTKENINTSWLSIWWSPHGGMT